jgi:chemotaxis response regulator CheB
MPQSAISAGVVDRVLPLEEIAPYLNVAVVTRR